MIFHVYMYLLTAYKTEIHTTTYFTFALISDVHKHTHTYTMFVRIYPLCTTPTNPKAEMCGCLLANLLFTLCTLHGPLMKLIACVWSNEELPYF